MTAPPFLPDTLLVLRDFVEGQRGGRPISELVITDKFLQTKHGIRWLIPFVLQAEALTAKH